MKEQKTVINKKKTPVNTGKKILIFVLAQILLMCSVLLAYNILAGGRIVVDTPYGYYTYYKNALEKDEKFEDTHIFESMLREALDNITIISVVRNQMETNGEFDGKKIIDISQYANRKNQNAEDEVTAKFYLEDLLKWSKYGMEYDQQKVRLDNYNNPDYSTSYTTQDTEGITDDEEDITDDTKDGTDDIEDAIENMDGPTVEVELSGAEYIYIEPNYAFANQSASENNAEDGDGYYIPEIWMKQSIDFYTPFSSFSDVYGDEDGKVYGIVDLLKCRYKTVDGKNLEELVDNWKDYFTLVHNLDTSMTNLAINYDSYRTYSSQYDKGKSNIKFCIRMDMNGEENYISNVEAFNAARPSENEITDYFTNSENKYLFYSPSDMIYLTNTCIEEDTLFDMLTNQYVEYAYPESTKIWVSVDTNYPVLDVFSMAHDQFEQNVNIPVGYMGLSVFILVIYLIIMIYLCCKAGWYKNEEGITEIKLNVFDRFHTEFFIIFAGAMILLTGFMWAAVLEGYDFIDSLVYNGIRWGADIVIGIVTIISGTLLGIFLLSFVRRIKGHNLWSDTLIMAIIAGVQAKWKESVSANKNRMISNWLLYLIYLIINFFMIFFAFLFILNSNAWIPGILMVSVALAFDIWVGFGLMRSINERFRIINGINRIREGEISYQVTEEMHGENTILAEAVNNIGDGIRKAVETSMKDERLKADLITNVSHDIKTPLTSIVNYVDLLKRENIQDEKIKGYIDILDSKSQRLKQLTEDLVEASKISSGNISYVFERLNLIELLNQAVGEFSEKFESKALQVVDNFAGQTAYIEADSRRMWRVMENLFNNIYKYALPNTRIYLTIIQETDKAADYVSISVKNISAQPLNIDASELTERFIRGDVSRSTEGSGLGLSIAKNLTEAQRGQFEIYLDGDLFKVTLTFPMM